MARYRKDRRHPPRPPALGGGYPLYPPAGYQPPGYPPTPASGSSYGEQQPEQTEGRNTGDQA